MRGLCIIIQIWDIATTPGFRDWLAISMSEINYEYPHITNKISNTPWFMCDVAQIDDVIP